MISVIVPIYNVEKYIVKCLESIVNQDYKDFELLLVNDGTKDNSIELANNYLKEKDINYKVINKENGGLASARNAGIKQAKGDYISFIDSDDTIAPNFLSTFKENIEKENVDFAFSNFEFVKEQTYPIDSNNDYHIYSNQELASDFLKRIVKFVVPTMFFKASFIKDNNLLFNEKIKFSEDQPFIWSAIFNSNKSIYLNRKLYGYYIRENSIMTSSSADKIITSFNEYSLYLDELKKKHSEFDYYFNLILPRWSLGALYTSANITEYKIFKNIYGVLSGKEIFDKVKVMKDRNSNILGLIAKISPRLLYISCRSIKL